MSMMTTKNDMVTIRTDELAAMVSAAIATAVADVMAAQSGKEPTTKVVTKADAKAAKSAKAKNPHYNAAVLDTKRVKGMVTRASKAFEAAGFAIRTSKVGTWVWVYPTGNSKGKGRTEEFKSVKLPKGWNYSPKRGAWYRDFEKK